MPIIQQSVTGDLMPQLPDLVPAAIPCQNCHMNMGVIIKSSRDTDVCAMHDMRVRPCAVRQLCQITSQRVMTISCVCVNQASSQRSMILSAMWDKCPHREL